MKVAEKAWPMQNKDFSVTRIDPKLAELIAKCDQKTLAIWSADCADRVLRYFTKNFPEDNRPTAAISAARAWARGEYKTINSRKAAFASHTAARDAKPIPLARSAARSAGHAAATAHVSSHAIYAAMYALEAINETGAKDAVVTEADWQYNHLKHLTSINLENVR